MALVNEVVDWAAVNSGNVKPIPPSPGGERVARSNQSLQELMGSIARWRDTLSFSTPGGADTNIQFNNAGAFGGSSNLTWNGSRLTVLGNVIVGAGTQNTVDAGGFEYDPANHGGTGLQSFPIRNLGSNHDVIIGVKVGGNNRHPLLVRGIDGAVVLRHVSVDKLETTATGVDVTGDVVATGTVDAATLSVGGVAITATPTEINLLDLAGLTAGWVLSADTATTASWKAAVAGGDVTKVGTPVNDQIGVWTGDGTLEGDPHLLWDGTDFKIGTAVPSLHFPLRYESDFNRLYLGEGGDHSAAQIYLITTSVGSPSIRWQQDAILRGAIFYHQSALAFKVQTNEELILQSGNLDALSFAKLGQAATFSSTINAAVGTTLISSLNIPTGVAKTSPAHGDIHATASDLIARIGGVDYSMIAVGDVTKVGTPANNQIGVWTGDGTIEGTSALQMVGPILTATGGYEGVSLDLINGVGAPLQTFQETAAALNEKTWQMGAFSGEWWLATVLDSGGVGNDILRITRTGAVVDTITVGGELIIDSGGTLAPGMAIKSAGTGVLELSNSGTTSIVAATNTAAAGANLILRSTDTGGTAQNTLILAPDLSATFAGNIALAGTVDGIDLQILNTAVGLNTAKVSNATHTGDVTGATALTIVNDAVTFAKMQNILPNFMLGRSTVSLGDVEALQPPAIRTMLNVADGSDIGTVTSIGILPGALIDVLGGPITTSGDITVSVDLNELIVTTANDATDWLPIIDSTLSQQNKITLSNLDLSKFNNDSSWNNYSHPNHTGDVTSVGDGALTIAVGAVDIAMLSATGIPSSSTFLRGDNTWASASGGSHGNHTGHITSVGLATTLVAAAITGQTALSGTTLSGTSEIIMNIPGTGIRKVDMDELIPQQTLTLASGLADTDEVLVSDSGVLKKMDVSVIREYVGLQIQTPVNVTAASHTFSGIPAGAKRITVMWEGVSTSSATSVEYIRLGDSGGIEATGYISSTIKSSASTMATSAATTGFSIGALEAAADLVHGQMILTHLGGDIWTMQGQSAAPAAGSLTLYVFSGVKSLTTALTQIQIITTGGGFPTFDAGSWTIAWEL